MTATSGHALRKANIQVRFQTKLALARIAKEQGRAPLALAREWVEKDLRGPARTNQPPRRQDERTPFRVDLDQSDFSFVTSVSKRTGTSLSETLELMADELLIGEDDPLWVVRTHFPSIDRHASGRLKAAYYPSCRPILGHLPLVQMSAIDELTNRAMGFHRATIPRTAIRRYRECHRISELPRKVPSVPLDLRIRELTWLAAQERGAELGLPPQQSCEMLLLPEQRPEKPRFPRAVPCLVPPGGTTFSEMMT